MTEPNHHWIAGWFPIPLLIFSAVFLTALYASPKPGDETVGLVFRPGTGFAEAAFFIGEAGGRVLEPGPSENIVIAHFAGGRTDLPEAAPVWFHFSAAASGSCLSASTRQQSTLPFSTPYPTKGDV